MSTRISLVKHDRPRILTIDFSEENVSRLRRLGYNARRGFTGLYDRGEFSIPWSIQDIEIIFASVASGTYTKASASKAHTSSVEGGPFFGALFREVWSKAGWIIFFIQAGCSPSEFTSVGIDNLGVVSHNRVYFPASAFGQLVKKAMNRDSQLPTLPSFPRFNGDAVLLDESAPESELLKRYKHVASFSVLSVENSIDIFGYQPDSSKWLTTDESASRAALAIKAQKYRDSTFSSLAHGAILFLPDFGEHNIDVAIGLLQEVIPDANAQLFDSPEHPWLEDYLPHPVNVIRARKKEIIETAKTELNTLDENENTELENFEWLFQLLISKGDEFRDSVAKALEFLGFDVEIIDNTISPGERKKEDLRLSDKETGYFALGEVKSTDRGASEGFLTDTQNHQGSYSRENKVPIPNAILVVNHSIRLDPSKRAGRFYTDQAVALRCHDQAITAIDSVALFSMCQSGLKGDVKREDVRRFIEKEPRIVSTYP